MLVFMKNTIMKAFKILTFLLNQYNNYTTKNIGLRFYRKCKI